MGITFLVLMFLILSSIFKLDDSLVAKELTISDSEHSDAEVSYTENGMFNLSRGQTPLTEGSEGERKHLLEGVECQACSSVIGYREMYYLPSLKSGCLMSALLQEMSCKCLFCSELNFLLHSCGA